MIIKFPEKSFNETVKLVNFILLDNFLFSSKFKFFVKSNVGLDGKTKSLFIWDRRNQDNILYILEVLMGIVVIDVDNGSRLKAISPEFKKLIHYLHDKVSNG